MVVSKQKINSNILEQRTHEYLIVKSKIEEKNELINKKIKQATEQFNQIEKEHQKQNELFKIKSEKASPDYLKKLQSANTYNNNLYSLEVKKHISYTEYLKNELKRNNLYLARIEKFLVYLKACIEQNEIDKINAYYQLLSSTQSEMLHELKSQKEIYNDKLDLHNDYLVFIKTCALKEQGNMEFLKTKIMNETEYVDAKTKKQEYEEKLTLYKNIFKEQKMNLTIDILKEKTFMKFDIEQIVEKVYEVENQKQK